jgi:hypothetical protein
LKKREGAGRWKGLEVDLSSISAGHPRRGTSSDYQENVFIFQDLSGFQNLTGLKVLSKDDKKLTRGAISYIS